MIMVKAGSPVDDVIAELRPHLEPGDVLIDGGNSEWTDTARRLDELAQHDILYLGSGVSGGEEGALHGPSLMPGGTRGVRPHRAGVHAHRRAGGRNPVLHLHR